ncbi:MAG: hypothetical protein EON47_06495 [Acetobacteraceae bacterium]|nr:MAG: hypothetical protein EON47_06495 [Acetobacteraceae bacterium]
MQRHLWMMAAPLLWVGAALAAPDAVLLASTAPGYGQGMVITAIDRLQIPEGASITLLLRSGQMLRLRGPLETALDHAMAQERDPASAVALAEALRLRGIDASAIGGTRATLPALRRPLPQEVTIEVQRSGTYCIGAGDTVWLQRPHAEQLEIALRRRGNLRRLGWPPDAFRIEWPGDVPIEDGDQFEVIVEGRPQSMLTFHALRNNHPEDAATIAAGILLGCREQYEAALRRLARSVVLPELWLDSNRGGSPQARQGNTIVIDVMANADGWLYCITRRSDGVAMPVFPTGAIGGARWTGTTSATSPVPRRGLSYPAGPPGLERIRCWLADRDISAELPHALLAGRGERLPSTLAENLDQAFRRIGASRIVGAELAIQVE